LIALCQLEEQGKEIDWNAAPFETHVKTLMSKKLLRLRLV